MGGGSWGGGSGGSGVPPETSHLQVVRFAIQAVAQRKVYAIVHTHRQAQWPGRRRRCRHRSGDIEPAAAIDMAAVRAVSKKRLPCILS